MKRWGMLVLLVCFLFAGCSQQDHSAADAKKQNSDKAKTEKSHNDSKNKPTEKTTSENERSSTDNVGKKDKRANKKYISRIKKISVAPTRKALKQQPAGILAKDIPYKAETENVVWALPDMKKAKRQKLAKQLRKLTSVTQDPKLLQKGLVYFLGSPNYERAIKKVEAFQPGFTMPYLPDPTKIKAKKEARQPDKTIILLDASSSMLLSVDGKRKMKIAKQAVKRFAKTIAQGKGNKVSLVVYGHKGSESDADKKLSCTSIEEIYPMDEYQQKKFEKALTTFEAKGWTPLAGAINKAAKMSRDYEKGVTVYIVSDGKETCGGGPIKAAKQFTKKHKKSTVNIIGFDVDAESENQLAQVAKAGDGKYYSADNPEELKATIEYEWLPSYMDLAWAFTKGPSNWDIIDEHKRFEERLKKVRVILERENHRYEAAIDILGNKEMLPEPKIEQLDQMIENRYEQMQGMLKAFGERKVDKIRQIADQIQKKVKKWTEKMSKLKEQQGDIW